MKKVLLIIAALFAFIASHKSVSENKLEISLVPTAEAGVINCDRECQAQKNSANYSQKHLNECGRELNKMLTDGKSTKADIENKVARCIDLKFARAAANSRVVACMQSCLKRKARGGSRFDGMAQ